MAIAQGGWGRGSSSLHSAIFTLFVHRGIKVMWQIAVVISKIDSGSENTDRRSGLGRIDTT